MLCTMDNRKRPRFELINVDNNDSDDGLQGVASSVNSLGTATLATIGGQSYILSNSTTSPIPANILLSICEENSNEAAEYILDHSILAPVKEEQTIAGQTNKNQSQSQQTDSASGSYQYRIVNQAGKILNPSSLNPTVINSDTLDVNSLNSLNLPPGCEIYVIKEVFDSPKQIIAESNTTSPSPKTISADTSSTKRKQSSSLLTQPRLIQDNSSTRNLSTNSSFSVSSSSPLTTTSGVTTKNTPDVTTKRSLILEAYKSRDDQRRATHNEVERRRRDKINSLIYKLKEMLPVEQYNSKTPRSTASSNSKTQILINACEYIKTMQDEMDFLRECLAENEDLRLKNESLEEEINRLRAKQQQQNGNNLLLTTNANHYSNNSDHNSDNSDSCEITLNSLNTTYANVQLLNPPTRHHLVGLTTANGTSSATNSVNVKYGKRELIITDYVD